MNKEQKCSILIVDDDSEFRDSARRLLWVMEETCSVELHEACNGSEAMEIVKKEDIDCVLLDYRMPGGTGGEWIGRFLEADADLAIVMVTGQGDEATAVEAMKSGAMDYLVKGAVSAETLLRAVTNATEKVTMHREIERQRNALSIAEKHRAMIQNLGTVCRHLAGPISTVTTGLEIIRRQELTPTLRGVVDQCSEAVAEADDLLGKLQGVGSFRTEPYLGAQACADGRARDAG